MDNKMSIFTIPEGRMHTLLSLYLINKADKLYLITPV